MLSQAAKEALIEGGKAAYQLGLRTAACPYDPLSNHGECWLQGWWESYRETRDSDAKHIATWLLNNVLAVLSRKQAEGIADFVVNLRGYDRTKPIEDNRIAGVEFTIPAPITLYQGSK